MEAAENSQELSLDEISVLIVESSKSQRQALRRHLSNQCIHRVTEAASGQEAMQILNESEQQLVISSMYLPDMTASDLITTLRESGDRSETPFMLLSSEARADLLEPLRQAGVIALLSKPLGQGALRRALLNTLQFLNPDALESDDFDPAELEVLVVDDAAFARAHISLVLKTLGIKNITQACDGTEAVAELCTRDFDLVVTDFNMPNMDGRELTEWIRNERGDADTPIIMVTSEHNESRLSAISQSGVSAMCDKPFQADTVKQLISQALSV
ncbi:MAG: response regulator [Gammaproteobacteria bacterium]